MPSIFIGNSMAKKLPNNRQKWNKKYTLQNKTHINKSVCLVFYANAFCIYCCCVRFERQTVKKDAVGDCIDAAMEYSPLRI